MSWKNYPLKKLHIELSSYCNAACPLCPRFISNSPNIRKDLDQTQISFVKFQEYFPYEVIESIDKILYCGTMGDPITNKDIIKIVDYVTEINPNCEQVVHTNGGIRSKEFWYKLGTIFNSENRKVTFSIDGLSDTNHLYRRNVSWQKLMQNTENFIKAGGHARWEFLVFEHNEHQIDQAKELSEKMGFKLFLDKKPFGFVNYSNNTAMNRDVFDKQGSVTYQLKPSTITKYNDQLPFGNHKELYEQAKVTKTSIDTLGSYVNELDANTINCASFENATSELYINSKGYVFPCCYVGTSYDGNIDNYLDYQIKTNINNNVELIDLNKKNIVEIVNEGIIDRLFSSQWNKKVCDGKIGFCSQTCGKKNPIDKIYVHSV